MTVQCIECHFWAPAKIDPKLAAHGLGLCEIFSAGPWETYTGAFQRTCDRFHQAPIKIVDARRQDQEPQP